MAMFRKALAILVIGAASATSVAAHASDWRDGTVRYTTVRHADAPRYYPPHRWVAPAYRWAPAPRSYWHPAYGYRGYAYHPGYRMGWRDGRSHDGWRGNNWRNDDHRDHYHRDND